MVIISEMDEKIKELEKKFKLDEERYYAENDFLVIKEKSKDKLVTIANDIDFFKQLVNSYPGFGNISQLTLSEDYSILFICSKTDTDTIKTYLHIKYGNDLEIGVMVEPIINERTVGEYYCSTVVPF
jgi:hypothetical protein